MNFKADLPKFILFALIGGIILLLLQNWVRFSENYDEDYLQSAPSTDASNNETINTIEEDIQSQLDPTLLAEDTLPDIAPDKADHSMILSSVDEDSSFGHNGRHIIVTTDTLRVTIDKLGGDIVEVAMLKHLASIDDKTNPLLLLEKNKHRTYVAQSGLVGPKGTNTKSAAAVFHALQQEYRMEGSEPLQVTLEFKDPSGIVLTKNFNFKSNDHLFDVSFNIENNSTSIWQGTFYSQINRDNSNDPGADSSGFGMKAYLGAATSTEESPYKKISFKDMEKKPFRNQHTGGWVAMLQHYFVSAWIPNQNQEHTFFSKKSKSGLNIIGFYSDPLVVQPGSSAQIGAQFYAGPKDQYRLKAIAEHLDLTVDYGWLWWLAQPLYMLLYFFATGELHIFGQVYDVFPGFGNWGFAIIMLTVFVKLVFFKLSAASYRSMANMRKVQPKLLALRERHGDDKQAQSKAMMELYQKEKINPLGGCLPILIQMPVFIALYWALMESVELRHAPFIGWIKDLSVMDPYFVLPIIMGATMWFQQKLNPPPPDPMQAKVMQWMPIIFTFFFLFFPAGLVVYWVSNNMLSIAQQWVITRQIENAD